MKNYDLIIIGSGFRALITAYLGKKKYKKILIVSKSNNLAGVMEPINWDGTLIDKGYQFFDGFSEDEKNILENFVGKQYLKDFGYGAASLTKGKIYEHHAIPYWPYHGKYFTVKAIIEIILNLIFRKKKKIYTYSDLINNHPNDIKEILKKACIRNFTLNSDELSFRSEDFSPFLSFRLTLFGDKVSKFLKSKFKILDNILATRRKNLNERTYSLYPFNKNMGFAAKLMEKNLKKIDVDFLNADNSKINYEDYSLTLELNNKSYRTKKIIITTELDQALNFFKKKLDLEQCEYYVPQIFFLFKTNKIVSKFQYIHGNDLNFLTNRASNYSLYGEKTNDNKNIIISEVPMDPESKNWKNPELLVNTIWNELKQMKLVDKKEDLEKYKFYNVKKTFCLPLKNFDTNYEIIKNFLKTEYDNKVILPAAGIITRGKYLKEIKNIFCE